MTLMFNETKYNEPPITIKQIYNRHKICYYCGVEYCSILKNGDRKTYKPSYCSMECVYKQGVLTRKKNGTYKNTPEQIEKRRITMLGKNETYGNKTLEKNKNKETITYDKNIYSHWTQDPKNKEFVSKNSQKKRTDKARKNMSIARLKLIQKNPAIIYSNCNSGFRKDLNTFFRSRLGS